MDMILQPITEIPWALILNFNYVLEAQNTFLLDFFFHIFHFLPILTTRTYYFLAIGWLMTHSNMRFPETELSYHSVSSISISLRYSQGFRLIGKTLVHKHCIVKERALFWTHWPTYASIVLTYHMIAHF